MVAVYIFPVLVKLFYPAEHGDARFLHRLSWLLHMDDCTSRVDIDIKGRTKGVCLIFQCEFEVSNLHMSPPPPRPDLTCSSTVYFMYSAEYHAVPELVLEYICACKRSHHSKPNCSILE